MPREESKSIIKSTGALIKRSTVAPDSNYNNYQLILRKDFHYSCAYCTITEMESHGIGFEIDHFQPISKNGAKSDYNNLMWSCQKCNSAKSDWWPNEEQSKRGYYVIRRDIEDPSEHFVPVGIRLVHKTVTGEFNINRLRLNRLNLRKLRELRSRLWNSREYLANGVFHILKIGIDRVGKQQRLNLLSSKKMVEDDYNNLIEYTKRFISYIAKSINLDKDQESDSIKKERRNYFRKINAISSDYCLPEYKRSKPKTRRKKSRKK